MDGGLPDGLFLLMSPNEMPAGPEEFQTFFKREYFKLKDGERVISALSPAAGASSPPSDRDRARDQDRADGRRRRRPAAGCDPI